MVRKPRASPNAWQWPGPDGEADGRSVRGCELGAGLEVRALAADAPRAGSDALGGSPRGPGAGAPRVGDLHRYARLRSEVVARRRDREAARDADRPPPCAGAQTDACEGQDRVGVVARVTDAIAVEVALVRVRHEDAV